MKIVHLVEDTSRCDIAVFIGYIKAMGGDHQIIRVQSLKFITRKIEADVIISHLAISWRRLPFLISLRNRHPGVRLMHVEHIYCEGYVENLGKPEARLLNVLRIGYSLFNRVIAISKGQGKWFLSCSLVSISRLLIIPSVADITRITRQPREFTQGSPLRILYIGELTHRSGLDILLEAFSAVKQQGDNLSVRLINPSFGEDLPGKYQEILDKDESITQIFENKSRNSLYEKSDIVAIPSRWEVSGVIAQEARAAGCIVVSSGIDALEEQSVSEELIFGTDVESWKYGLQNIQQLPLETYADLGYQRVRKEYSTFLRRWQSLLNMSELPTIDEQEIREALHA